MAPSIKFNYEDIVTEAIKIVREQGIEAVNARSIAKNLNSSIHPIFRTFGTMDDLKSDVYKRCREIYLAEMEKGLNKDGVIGLGLAYIKFAKDEKNLFRFLFMSNVYNQRDVAGIIGTLPRDGEIIALINKTTGLQKSKATELYSEMWFMVHGIASLLATNNSIISDKEAKRILNNVYSALIYSKKNYVSNNEGKD